MGICCLIGIYNRAFLGTFPRPWRCSSPLPLSPWARSDFIPPSSAASANVIRDPAEANRVRALRQPTEIYMQKLLNKARIDVPS